jgi:hypothetical protein
MFVSRVVFGSTTCIELMYSHICNSSPGLLRRPTGLGTQRVGGGSHAFASRSRSNWGECVWDGNGGGIQAWDGTGLAVWYKRVGDGNGGGAAAWNRTRLAIWYHFGSGVRKCLVQGLGLVVGRLVGRWSVLRPGRGMGWDRLDRVNPRRNRLTLCISY